MPSKTPQRHSQETNLTTCLWESAVQMEKSAATRRGGNGCGTCKGNTNDTSSRIGPADRELDRRIKCDLGLPTCLNCARSRRLCQGYRIRLSWPRKGDSKRAVVAPVKSRWRAAVGLSEKDLEHLVFVNTQVWHIVKFHEAKRRNNMCKFDPQSSTDVFHVC